MGMCGSGVVGVMSPKINFGQGGRAHALWCHLAWPLSTGWKRRKSTSGGVGARTKKQVGVVWYPSVHPSVGLRAFFVLAPVCP